MKSTFCHNRPEFCIHDVCHVCGANLPSPVLDLGLQPLCDDLVPIGDDRVTTKYPIQISICPVCLTAHQVCQVAKEMLFPRNYHYRARFTQDVLNGMQHLVDECCTFIGDLSGKLVCDVGCNDGSLLGFFKNVGAQTCGIEPTNAALDANEFGHKTIQDYFSPNTAAGLVAEVGKPDVITFTNVFAHIESLHEAIEGLKILLHKRSIVVIENHYLGSVLALNQFDTFYHEHPRTYSLRSFNFIAKSLGGEVLRATFPKRYGGNIRIYIGNFHGARTYTKSATPDFVTPDESTFVADLGRMQIAVDRWKAETLAQMRHLQEGGLVLYGKSFPGRASIPITLLGVTERNQPYVYEQPGSLKLGNYVPGTRIEIVSDDRWIRGQDNPPAMLVWGWHIAKEITTYVRQNGYLGRIFKILPSFQQID